MKNSNKIGFKNIIPIIGILLLGLASCLSPELPKTMREISGLEIAAEMAPGVNLYNTLDANEGRYQGLKSEICWEQPYTTKAMIDAYAKKGIKTLRLPTTWYNHMGPAPEYKITEEWLNRIEEVANYAFDNGMYVIINIHHDDYDKNRPGTWLCPTYEKQVQVTKQLEKVWTQIATHFINYNHHLIFETMNEPRLVGSELEWNGGGKEERDVVNALNLAAVNAIRRTGGNNTSRFIMIPQVTASTEIHVLDAFKIPNNDPNIIISIHNYGPYEFCLKRPGTKTWGTPEDKLAMDKDFELYYDKFISKGRAVVIGEWGVANKDNLADRLAYYEHFINNCKKKQVTPIAWICDFDRESQSFPNEIADKIVKPYALNK